jgi:predicted double-glycine peptidase
LKKFRKEPSFLKILTPQRNIFICLPQLLENFMVGKREMEKGTEKGDGRLPFANTKTFIFLGMERKIKKPETELGGFEDLQK